MKLYEILDYSQNVGFSEIPIRTGKAIKPALDKLKQQHPHTKHLTSGNNASVAASDDPHYADRVWRTAPEEDGGTIWLKYVSEHPELQNNPFVPKVLEKQKGDIVTYQVEKLIPFNVHDIIGNEALMNAKLSQYFNQPELKSDITRKRLMLRYIGYIFNMKEYEIAKDQQLVQVAKHLHNFVEQNKGKYVIDLGDENIMWRMTQHGPQLVIVDPLWTV